MEHMGLVIFMGLYILKWGDLSVLITDLTGAITVAMWMPILHPMVHHGPKDVQIPAKTFVIIDGG